MNRATMFLTEHAKTEQCRHLVAADAVSLVSEINGTCRVWFDPARNVYMDVVESFDDVSRWWRAANSVYTPGSPYELVKEQLRKANSMAMNTVISPLLKNESLGESCEDPDDLLAEHIKRLPPKDRFREMTLLARRDPLRHNNVQRKLYKLDDAVDVVEDKNKPQQVLFSDKFEDLEFTLNEMADATVLGTVERAMEVMRCMYRHHDGDDSEGTMNDHELCDAISEMDVVVDKLRALQDIMHILQLPENLYGSGKDDRKQFMDEEHNFTDELLVMARKLINLSRDSYYKTMRVIRGQNQAMFRACLYTVHTLTTEEGTIGKRPPCDMDAASIIVQELSEAYQRLAELMYPDYVGFDAAAVDAALFYKKLKEALDPDEERE